MNKKTTLSTEAFLINGTAVKPNQKTNKNGNVLVTRRDDINEYNVLIFKYTIKMFIEDIKEEKFLRIGDILFVVKGAKRIAAVVTNLTEKAIAVPSFCIIRIKNQKELLPEFLSWYLNQETVKTRLNQFLVGATIPCLQKKALETLEIPIISVEEQEKILKVAELQQKEQILMKRLLIKKDLLITQRLLARVEA